MVPRILHLEIAKQWVSSAAVAASSSSGWSPRELLGNGSFFPPSSSLKVKRSTSRFFMYEEHGSTKLEDNNQTQVVQLPPSELADWLHDPPAAPEKHRQQEQHQKQHCYWTSPVAHVAPALLTQRLKGYDALHQNHCHHDMLDPRGPSLWMGTNGSATQAHYDVADNVIVQLFGTKRIRCYPPKAATALYVFPDAHPRARKSQVNFDAPDCDRFQHFATLPSPVLDVVLKPGDAIRIPAFWFHHVENGKTTPSPTTSTLQDQQQEGPSVSANIFALSSSMIIAQGIFRDASRPLGNLAEAPSKQHNPSLEAQQQYEYAVAALRALGFGLVEGLVQRLGMTLTPLAFIQTCLLDTRYAPLRLNHGGTTDSTTTMGEPQQNRTTTSIGRGLTTSEQKQVAKCLERILPQFASLLEEGDSDPDGIVSLVACHLLELWAVELVGASSLADAWQAALLRDD
jgi:hypothetical protein